MTTTRIRTGVKGFIVHEGKILVVREHVHRDGKTHDIYDVPGGGIEPGETLHEALTRELMEEVGLEVEIEQPVGGWEFFFPTPTGQTHIVCLGYQCRLIGEPNVDLTKNPAQEDIFEVKWMTKEELLASDDILVTADMRDSLRNVKV